MMELTKMDGAIVLSKDMKRINYANVLLTHSSQIHTSETGTRHKAAERTAKQIRGLTIAISERRDEVTLYYKNVRYPPQESSEVLRKANEHSSCLKARENSSTRQSKNLTAPKSNPITTSPWQISAIQKGL
jgi:diadenylate cyclase